MKRLWRWPALAALFCLAACAPRGLAPHPVHYDALPGWEADDHAAALRAFRASCVKISAMPPEAVLGKGDLAAPARLWQPACRAAAAVGPGQARQFFQAHFTPFSPGGSVPGLFTGYYEPLLSGAWRRGGPYQTPVYALPADVREGVPYHTRAGIAAGALTGKKLELLWVDDAVAFFFAQVQGSARVRMQSGETVRIAYAGKNQHPYVAIGKVLKDAGELEEVNLFTLRAWLEAHPSRAERIMHRNPSYVFFRLEPDDGLGPKGAQGVPLMPERSLAVDARFIPYGMPLFVQTELAVTEFGAARPFNRLLIAQDTGSAIKGPVRGDIFFGAGRRAEALAGMMKAPGTYVLLLPNSLAARL